MRPAHPPLGHRARLAAILGLAFLGALVAAPLAYERDLRRGRERVGSGSQIAATRFTPDKLEDVVEYLNRSHYRFGLSPLQRKPSTRKP